MQSVSAAADSKILKDSVAPLRAYLKSYKSSLHFFLLQLRISTFSCQYLSLESSKRCLSFLLASSIFLVRNKRI